MSDVGARLSHREVQFTRSAVAEGCNVVREETLQSLVSWFISFESLLDGLEKAGEEGGRRRERHSSKSINPAGLVVERGNLTREHGFDNS